MSIQPIESAVVYKDIPEFPGYRVGDDGSVWSSRPIGRQTVQRAWRTIAQYRNQQGYMCVKFSFGNKGYGFLVHRLVLMAFVGPCPEGMEGCHADGNRANNSLVNLRWDTREANEKDKVQHGTSNRGERNGNAKLTYEKANAIRTEYELGVSGYRKLAKRFGVSPDTIRSIIRRGGWSQ